MTTTDAAPPTSPWANGPTTRKHPRRRIVIPLLVAVLAVAVLAAWWTLAAPQVHVSDNFVGDTGQATASTVTFSTTIRNDGRLEAVVSPGAVPPNVGVVFRSPQDSPPKRVLRLPPGEEAVVVVTVTGDVSCTAAPGSEVSAYVALRAESWGRSTEEVFLAPVQFPLCDQEQP